MRAAHRLRSSLVLVVLVGTCGWAGAAAANADPLPEGAVLRIGSACFLRPGTVTDLAYAPDSKTLVSASKSGTVHLWEPESGRHLGALEGHKGSVETVLFSSNSRALFSGGQDATIRMWDVANRKQVVELKSERGPIYDLAMPPQSATLASCGHRGALQMWDLRTNKVVSDMNWHTFMSSGDAVAVAFTPDGKTFATGALAWMQCYVYTPGKDKKTRELECGGKPFHTHSLAFSPDGKHLAGGTSQGACIWDVETGKALRQFRQGAAPDEPRIFEEGEKPDTYQVAYTADGRALVTRDGDHKARVWDLESGKCQVTIDHDMTCMAVSPDSKTLASGNYWGAIRLWDLATGERTPNPAIHDAGIGTVALVDDGTLATASLDGTVRLWNAATGKAIRSFPGDPAGIMAMATSPDGTFIASGGFSRNVIVWDSKTGATIHTLRENDAITELAFSPDSRLLASCSYERRTRESATLSIRFYDLANGKVTSTITHPGRVAVAIAFSPDGKTLAAKGDDGVLNLWDVATGKALRTVATIGKPIRAVAFSPDGARVAVTDDAGGARVLNAETGKELVRLEGGSFGIAFSPDGQRIAAGSTDNVVRVWDANTGKCLLERNGHEGWVTTVAFATDGKTLITGSADSTVLVWDVASATAR